MGKVGILRWLITIDQVGSIPAQCFQLVSSKNTALSSKWLGYMTFTHAMSDHSRLGSPE
jgi:hypothetical protein